jgi:hypothetical protein
MYYILILQYISIQYMCIIFYNYVSVIIRQKKQAFALNLGGEKQTLGTKLNFQKHLLDCSPFYKKTKTLQLRDIKQYEKQCSHIT